LGAVERVAATDWAGRPARVSARFKIIQAVSIRSAPERRPAGCGSCRRSGSLPHSRPRTARAAWPLRRRSFTGGPLLRGQVNGGGTLPRLPRAERLLLASINVALDQSADESRTVVLLVRGSAAAFDALKAVHAEVFTPASRAGCSPACCAFCRVCACARARSSPCLFGVPGVPTHTREGFEPEHRRTMLLGGVPIHWRIAPAKRSSCGDPGWSGPRPASGERGGARPHRGRVPRPRRRCEARRVRHSRSRAGAAGRQSSRDEARRAAGRALHGCATYATAVEEASTAWLPLKA
jgi:hypothetical protein